MGCKMLGLFLLMTAVWRDVVNGLMRLGLGLGCGTIALPAIAAVDPPPRIASEAVLQVDERTWDAGGLAQGRSLTLPDFGSPRLNQQLALYWDYVAAGGPPDVLIVGSSRSLQGIDPAVLAQTLAQQGRPNLRVYNFGINGATAQVVQWVLTQLLADRRSQPQIVIWGDGSRAFNSGRPDHTFAGLQQSAGYRQTRQGWNLGILLADAAQTQLTTDPKRLADTTQALGQAGAALAAGCRIANTSPPGGWLLYQTQRRLTLRYGCDRVVNLPTPPPVAAADLGGSGALTGLGFLPDPRRFNPATYYRQYPRVAGQYDGSYNPFTLAGVQAQALERAIALARSQQVPLVFVNLPLSGDYLDPVRSRHEQTFQTYLQQVAGRSPGFSVRDYLRQWPQRNDHFADPSHINAAGAAAVARDLGRDRTLPWPPARP